MTVPDWTLLLATGLPFLGGLLMLVVSCFPSARRTYTQHLTGYITLVIVGLTAQSTLFLLPHASYSPPAVNALIQVEWLPGTGPMTVSPGTTGLYAALVTSWSAFFVLLAGSRDGQDKRFPLSGALILIALAAANAAFLAQHFLGRYVALEIAALGVALMPLVKPHGATNLRAAKGRHDATGTSLSTATYLILRIGDAGLLAAILILMHAGDTLDIASALEAGKVLDTARLNWTVAGLLLAVWIKQGVWPFHLWLHGGRALSLTGRAWLYAIVMPNLGAYLLYRITPLLVLSPSLRLTTLALGSGSAVVAMLLAFTAIDRTKQLDMRTGLIYLGAAQGGLALFVAASGIKSLVWLSLILLTWPRLLLFLSADTVRRTTSQTGRQLAAAAFGLGALFATVSALLITWWSRKSDVQSGTFLFSEGAFFAAQTALSLTIIWSARVVRRFLANPVPKPLTQDENQPMKNGTTIGWSQWIVMSALGFCILAGGLAWKPLVDFLLSASHAPSLPPITMGHVAAFALSLVTAGALIAGIRVLGQKKQEPTIQPLGQKSQQEHPAPPKQDVFGLEESLVQVAKILRNVIEVNIQERILVTIVYFVVNGARWMYQVMETRFLESILSRSVRMIVRAGHTAYRAVEQNSLEGTLRQIPRGIMVLNRGLQRLHTGKLRHNLIWVVCSLTIAILALLLL